MDLKDYLLLTLEQKYRLTSDEGAVLTAIVSAIRDRHIPVALQSCPRLDAFKDVGYQGLHEVSKTSVVWFKFMLELQHCSDQGQVYALIDALMEHPYVGVSKMALVLTSEWRWVGQTLVAEPAEVEPEGKPETPTDEVYKGWLATGQYILKTPSGDSSVPDKEEPFDLNTRGNNGNSVEVLLAQVMFAAFDKDTNSVDPRRLENLPPMLATVFGNERLQYEAQLKQLNDQLATNQMMSKLWPANEQHWIYDPELSKLNVAWPTPSTSPLRDYMATTIEKAAKFAMSRASAMGSSRVFNIEAFLHNMIVGLIGDGAGAEGEFDWANLIGTAKPVKVAARPRAKSAAKAK